MWRKLVTCYANDQMPGQDEKAFVVGMVTAIPAAALFSGAGGAALKAASGRERAKLLAEGAIDELEAFFMGPSLPVYLYNKVTGAWKFVLVGGFTYQGAKEGLKELNPSEAVWGGIKGVGNAIVLPVFLAVKAGDEIASDSIDADNKSKGELDATVLSQHADYKSLVGKLARHPDLVRMLARVPLKGPPGRQYSYAALLDKNLWDLTEKDIQLLGPREILETLDLKQDAARIPVAPKPKTFLENLFSSSSKSTPSADVSATEAHSASPTPVPNTPPPPPRSRTPGQ